MFKAILRLACFSAALVCPRSCTGHALHSTVHNCITVLRDMYSMYRNAVYFYIGCIISILQFVFSFKVEYAPRMALCTNFCGMYKAPLLHKCKLPTHAERSILLHKLLSVFNTLSYTHTKHTNVFKTTHTHTHTHTHTPAPAEHFILLQALWGGGGGHC